MNYNKNLTGSPLLSILIYDYYSEHLERCLNSIFNQHLLTSFEVIYFSNGSPGQTAGKTIREFTSKFPDKITLKFGRRKGKPNNLCLASHMATGKFIVELNDDDIFDAATIKKNIKILEDNPFLSFHKIHRKHLVLASNHYFQTNKQPLVSILIHNWNYGRFLRQCLNSVFSQTYSNIEVIFSDNASADNSWDIAVEYADRYPDRMTIIRNRKNFGPTVNLENCYQHIHGQYYCTLCSDDALLPEFIQKCVTALEKYPDTAFAITHSHTIDACGNQTQEIPFYNQSCIIPGEEQAAVYMMAAVNASISQIVYRTEMVETIKTSNNIISRWFNNRILDFTLCCRHPIIYLKEALILHRIHDASDSHSISENMVELFGQYLLIHQFAESASREPQLAKAAGRLPSAVDKLSTLCLRYCANSLIKSNEIIAKKYFHLAVAISPEVQNDNIFKILQSYWATTDRSRKKDIITQLETTKNLSKRQISYEPPSNSQILR